MNEKLKIEPAVVYERKGQYFPDEIREYLAQNAPKQKIKL